MSGWKISKFSESLDQTHFEEIFATFSPHLLCLKILKFFRLTWMREKFQNFVEISTEHTFIIKDWNVSPHPYFFKILKFFTLTCVGKRYLETLETAIERAFKRTSETLHHKCWLSKLWTHFTTRASFEKFQNFPNPGEIHTSMRMWYASTIKQYLPSEKFLKHVHHITFYALVFLCGRFRTFAPSRKISKFLSITTVCNLNECIPWHL